MGAWGTGPFDNDDAGDWGSTLADAADPAPVLADTFAALATELAEEDVVSSGTANEAIAAAAWLAAGVTGGPPLPERSGLPAPRPPEPTQAAAALAALDVVRGSHSEWLEVWQEAGEDATVLAGLERIAAALRTVA